MLTLNEIITFEHENEHDLEHDLAHKKDFSNPKIYTANGDLSKRWYVYYSFRNPKTGKLKRLKNIYGSVNSFKNKEDRLALLSRYRKRLLNLLKEGYDPYVNNTALYQSKIATKTTKKVPIVNSKKQSFEASTKVEAPKIEVSVSENKENAESKSNFSLREAFDYSLKLKEKLVGKRTLQDYQYASNALVKWANENHPDIKSIDQFNKKAAMDYLNDVLLRSSSRNRNNYRLSLSSLMQILEDNEIITENPMKKTSVLRTVPKRNKAYNKADQEKIFEYLEKEDPILLLFIKFVSYNFLRPLEVCRLKVKDFDLNNNTIQFKAKNSPLKTKLIPKILLDELPDLSKLDPDAYLFTPNKIGGTWETSETNKRGYFTKQFKEVVKDHFNLDKNQGLYSFRHTFITKLYRALVKNSSSHAAKSELMGITGHSTMDALEKYLRDIDAELPKDYSHLL